MAWCQNVNVSISQLLVIYFKVPTDLENGGKVMESNRSEKARELLGNFIVARENY